MGRGFKETAHLKTNTDKFDFGYAGIDWSNTGDKTEVTKVCLDEVMPKKKDHDCTYSRSINQEYPRKCVICGEVEKQE